MAYLVRGYGSPRPCTAVTVMRGCTRGGAGRVYWVGTGRVYWEGLYRYPSPLVPGPIISHILDSRPYPRPYEGNIKEYDEVSQMGLEKGPDMTSESTRMTLRIDPPRPSPDWSRDCPRSLISRPQISYGQIRPLFHVLLTIAERIHDWSKDWIRPPTRCQE